MAEAPAAGYQAKSCANCVCHITSWHQEVSRNVVGKRDTKWSKPKRVLLHPHMPDLHPVAGVAFLRFSFLLPWLLYLPSHSRDARNATSPLRPLIRLSSILKPSPSRARVVLSWKNHKTQDDGKVRRRDLGQGVALLPLFSGQVFFRCVLRNLAVMIFYQVRPIRGVWSLRLE